MRESGWLWKIDERIDTQRCLLEQRVRSYTFVSDIYMMSMYSTKTYYRRASSRMVLRTGLLFRDAAVTSPA